METTEVNKCTETLPDGRHSIHIGKKRLFFSFLFYKRHCFCFFLLLFWSAWSQAGFQYSYHTFRKIPGVSSPVHMTISYSRNHHPQQVADPELLHALRKSDYLVQGYRETCEPERPHFCPVGIILNRELDPETDSAPPYLSLTEETTHSLVVHSKPDIARSLVQFADPGQADSDQEDDAGPGPAAFLTLVTLSEDEEQPGASGSMPYGGSRKSVELPSGGGFFDNNDQDFKPWFGGGQPSDQVLMMLSGYLFHAVFGDDQDNSRAIHPEGVVMLVLDEDDNELERTLISPEELMLLARQQEAAHLAVAPGGLRNATLTLRLKDHDQFQKACGSSVPGIISCMFRSGLRSSPRNHQGRGGSGAMGQDCSVRHSSSLWPGGSDGGDGGHSSEESIRCGQCGRTFRLESELTGHMKSAHAEQYPARGDKKATANSIASLFSFGPSTEPASATYLPEISQMEFDELAEKTALSRTFSEVKVFLAGRLSQQQQREFLVKLSQSIEAEVVSPASYLTITRTPMEEALDALHGAMQRQIQNDVTVNKKLLGAIQKTAEAQSFESALNSVIYTNYSGELSARPREIHQDSSFQEYYRTIRQALLSQVGHVVLGQNLQMALTSLLENLPMDMVQEIHSTYRQPAHLVSPVRVTDITSCISSPLIIGAILRHPSKELQAVVDKTLHDLWKHTESSDVSTFLALIALDITGRNFLVEAGERATAATPLPQDEPSAYVDTSKNRLGISGIFEIKTDLWDARTKWKNLGYALGIDAETIEEIDLSQRNVADCFTKLLTKWLQGSSFRGKPVTPATLLNALSDRSVGESALAASLAEMGRYPVAKARLLNIRDLERVRAAAWSARSRSFMLGLALGIDISTLEVIQRDCNHNQDEIFVRVLKTWLQSDRLQKTVDKLVEALKSKGVGYGALAYEVKQTLGNN